MRQSLDKTLRYEAGTHHQREPPRGAPFGLYPLHSRLCWVSLFAPPPSFLLCVREADWSGLCGWCPVIFPSESPAAGTSRRSEGRGQGVAAGRPCPWTEGHNPLKAALSGWLSLLGSGTPPIFPPFLSLHCPKAPYTCPH